MDTRDMSEIETAAALLRAAGWFVAPPLPAGVPKPEVGQRWVNPKQTVATRLVTAVGQHRSHRWAPYCVFYRRGVEAEAVLSQEGWEAWVRNSGARPA